MLVLATRQEARADRSDNATRNHTLIDLLCYSCNALFLVDRGRYLLEVLFRYWKENTISFTEVFSGM